MDIEARTLCAFFAVTPRFRVLNKTFLSRYVDRCQYEWAQLWNVQIKSVGQEDQTISKPQNIKKERKVAFKVGGPKFWGKQSNMTAYK